MVASVGTCMYSALRHLSVAMRNQRCAIWSPHKNGLVTLAPFLLHERKVFPVRKVLAFSKSQNMFHELNHLGFIKIEKYRNLRRPCVRTTACLNSRIPAAGVSAPCRLNKTQQSKLSNQNSAIKSLSGDLWFGSGSATSLKLRSRFTHGDL